ncbi:TerD family protein [Fimbriiglobus ruber]|uniref:TerD family protein n=1 Tax=Fimbriiglobus ruber TaxID=1908690 RepID=UPI0011798A4C|nr:TerD family protein [Fimbriiglobus ruber]
MNALEIYLTKCRKIIVQGNGKQPSSSATVATFNRNLISLGFVCSQEVTGALAGLSEEALGSLYRQVVPILKQMTGVHRTFKPMYPNFPKQVMEASDFELYLNAIAHYWMAAARDMSQGQPRLFGGRLTEGASSTPAPVDTLNVPLQWLPEYEVENRESLPEEEIHLKVINLGNQDDFWKVFTRLVGSNGSLSESDKAIVQWFVDNQREDIPLFLPPAIPQKENLTFLVGSLLKHEIPTYLIPYLKTATDVLRVAVVMSDGDVSLATPGKFRRFKRTERRFLLDALEALPAVTEDMLRRPEVWKRFGRELRPGDYASRYQKTLKAFDVVRNNEAFETFNSKVEAGLIRKDVVTVIDLLKTRPGDFARRFDHLLRTSGEQANVAVQGFMDVAHKVSTPVLLQVHAHFKNRDRDADHRAFFPKGSVAKVQVIDETLSPLPSLELAGGEPLDKFIARFVRNVLVMRFKPLPSLGKVYLDEALRTQNVPFAQRSASKALRTLARGSRLTLPTTDTLRFFVWWKEPQGQRTDIDLAAVFFSADWKRLADVAYYNLKDWGSVHSGDITSAPVGAAEFIDVHLPTLREKAVRYVSMVIYSFTQQAFKDLPECFAGWMARQKVQSGEIFEARTVQDKIDIAGDTTVNIPLFFDLQENQVVWSDIALKSRGPINNSGQAGENLVLMGKAITGLIKPTLYDLFDMHAEARGNKVDSPSGADTVFSLHDGITPFDADRIMSEFMTNGTDQSEVQGNVVYVTET